MIATLLDVLAVAALALGLLLATIGLYGLLRMPDLFSQLHPAGLVSGPAVILVLLASIATGSTEIVTSAALVTLFVLITAPLSSHAIAQAAYEGEEAEQQPSEAGDSGVENPDRPQA